MSIEKSYLNKLTDFGITAGTFKDDSGQTVNYRTVQIELLVDGKPEVISLSGQSAPKPAHLDLMLRSADNPDTIQDNNTPAFLQ